MTPSRRERKIELRSVTHFAGRWTNRICLYQNFNAVFKSGTSYLIFADEEAQPGVMLKLLSGESRPSRGRIVRSGSVSPVMGAGALPFYSRTVRDAIALIARIYNADFNQLLDRVRLYIGDHDLREELSDLTLQARTCLSYGLGYSVPADFYLFRAIAPPLARSSPAVLRRCIEAFEARRQSASTIIVSSSTNDAHALAEAGGVIHNGQLRLFDSVSEAAHYYDRLTLHETQSVFARVRSMVQRGLVDEAREFLNSPRALAELQESSTEDVAKAHLAAGDVEQALRFAREAQELRPDAFSTNLLLARTADRAGSHELAVSSALGVLRVDSNHGLARLILARNLERLSRFQEAADVWRTLAGSDSGASLRSLIRCQMRAGDYAGALASIDQIGNDLRHDKTILFARFECVVRTGTEDDIVGSFQHILSMRSDEAVLAMRKHIPQLPPEMLPRLAGQILSAEITQSSIQPLDLIIRHLRSKRFTANENVRSDEAILIADRLALRRAELSG